jgi:phage terminase large subunit-like protein
MRREDKIALEQYLAKLDFIEKSGHVNHNESPEQKRARIARAKADYKFCTEYYFPHFATSGTPDFHVSLANKIKRDPLYKGLVRWGRGLAKSVVCGVTEQFWLWLNGQNNFLVLIGQNDDKARLLLSDLQAEFECNPQIINDFGEQKKFGSWEDGYFVTKSGFIGKSLGMGQSPRGLRERSQRPTTIVADDLDTKEINKNPARMREMAKWLLRDVLPTMDGPLRRFMFANTYHAPLTIGEILRLERPNWDVDRVDAYDPVTKLPIWHQKYSPDYYKVWEEEIGVLAALAEFNNTPHTEGSIFKQEQEQWIDYPVYPALNHMRAIAGHWDIAYAGTATSDYNAVRVWGTKDKNFYHVSSFVRQCKMKEALQWMSWKQKEMPSSVTIHWRFEAQFWNDEVYRCIREVENFTKVNLNLVKVEGPKQKKYDRILKLQPYYQNRRVYFNKKDKGNQDLIVGQNQLYGIEPGYKGHDDAPDADQQCYEYLEKFNRADSGPSIILGERGLRGGAW